jgi:hypothetical protein
MVAEVYLPVVEDERVDGFAAVEAELGALAELLLQWAVEVPPGSTAHWEVSSRAAVRMLWRIDQCRPERACARRLPGPLAGGGR